MASDRLAELLRLRIELSEEEISRMTETTAWQWVHTNGSTLDETDNDLHNFKNI